MVRKSSEIPLLPAIVLIVLLTLSGKADTYPCYLSLCSLLTLSEKADTYPCYTPIAFDEIVAFWLQRAGSLPCACSFAALHACAIALWLYASIRANNATYAHAQGSDRTR